MLEGYRKKRDFSRTPEPEPQAEPSAGGSLKFVVQQHAARRLHYDFRLEVDDVLKSWPVPKGPSLDPEEKRLAVMVEDHPLDYGTFEGIIPKGDYGAGQVIVWDAGIYSPDENGRLSFRNRDEAQERMREGLEAGKLSFTLRGRKLQGSWTLVRTQRDPKEWLLIKHRDGYADASRDVLEDERSVLSGLTISDVKAGRVPDPARAFADRIGEAGQPAPFPSRLTPMQARSADQSFSHPEWLFEPKLDGFRAIAFLRRGQVVLHSRNGNDITSSFPEVVNELAVQPEEELVLDGEIVALNEEGLPDFGLLQQSLDLPKKIRVAAPSSAGKIIYYPFDLLHANGFDLKQLPLLERKALLNQVLLPGDAVKLVEHVEEDGEAFFQAAVQTGLEGMVAKRLSSSYEPGIHSRSWLKIKRHLSQEFVVVGCTKGSGARSATFGALLLGYYDGEELRYAGKVGSGFDQSMLQQIRDLLRASRTDKSPLTQIPDVEESEIEWIRPDELVVQVKFTQWTHEGRLRAPVFTGIRPDLDPRTVRREVAEAGFPSGVSKSKPRDDAEPGDVEEVLEQLLGDQEQMVMEVGGHRLSLTNLSKALWPGDGTSPPITKRDMIHYYARMAPVLLPHLRHRPLTLTRYPDGILGESFYQKHWREGLPDFVETVRLFSSHNEGDVEYIMVNNLPTLVWLAQVADIELHPWISRTVPQTDAAHLSTAFTGSKETLEGSVLNYPDFIVFDLDPYIYSGKEKAGDEPELNRRAFAKAVEVARDLKDILDELSLSSFLKTSGKTGLHVYVPVLRRYDYKVVRKSCEVIGRFLMQNRPQDVTMEWAVDKRGGKMRLRQ